MRWLYYSDKHKQLDPQKKAPRCPSWLEQEAKKEWRRIGKLLEVTGVLTEMDMAAFADYCQAYARWKEAEGFITQHVTMIRTPYGYLISAFVLVFPPK